MAIDTLIAGAISRAPIELRARRPPYCSVDERDACFQDAAVRLALQ
ncbi:hypothetical protein IFT54_18550 [Sphingomonas sp. CFBP 13714]|nr:hypothetical protein [Sphingomonas sp. CFBP 13714]MBD8701817.1 hypothetical protein [Sphingomonas sp. CFBP 13714]